MAGVRRAHDLGRGAAHGRRSPAASEGRLIDDASRAPGRDVSDPALSAVRPPFSEQEARRLGPLRQWFWRHPVATDWTVAACFAGPAVLTAQPTSTATGSTVLLLALVAVGFVALLARRRAPALVLAVVTALAVTASAVTGGLSGFDLGIAFAVYAVAADRTPLAAWTTLGAASTCVTVVVLAGSRTGETVLSELTGFALLTFAAMAIGAGVRNRRLHVTELVERGNTLARETEQRTQLATADERARISREMHDVVAHSLSVMIALADGASASLDRSPALARAAIDEVSTTGRAALSDMRRVLGVLRDPDASFGPAPGGSDLESLAQSFRAAGLPVDLTTTGDPLPADTGLQLAVYRIVQESLTNALRHTRGAGRAVTCVGHTAGTVTVEVTDDGGLSRTVRSPVGTPLRGLASGRVDDGRAPAPGGRGIIGMRERAAIYSGTVEAGPHGDGWRVEAVLHWDQEEL